MASIPKMLVIIPILLISKIPVLICHTIICSLTLLCLCGNVPPNPPVGELPEHTHTASTNTAGDHSHTFTFGRSYESDRGVPGGGDGDRTYTNSTNTAGSHIHTIAISNTGNDRAHNNMQPYISVFMWQRVS